MLEDPIFRVDNDFSNKGVSGKQVFKCVFIWVYILLCLISYV